MPDRGRHDARPWLGRLGRAGLLAKGVLYGLVGVLAARIALGDGSQEADQQGAIAAVASGPFGRIILAVLAIGFGAYAGWRAVQAWTDTGDEDGLHGLVLRASNVVRSLLYAGLALTAGRQVLAGRSSGGDDLEHSLTAQVLEVPVGTIAVAGVGAVLVGVGLYQGWLSATQDFREDLRTMTPDEHRWVSRLGVIGHAARAVVFVLVGGFVIHAALLREATDNVGLDGALGELNRRPFGAAMLLTVSAGLLVYGLYCLAEARFGRIRVDD